MTSCSYKSESKQIETIKILDAKKIETQEVSPLTNGYIFYKLIFSDGYVNRTSLDCYNSLKEGDTVTLVKNKGERDFWLIVKLKK